jgi:hypothetical protein
MKAIYECWSHLEDNSLDERFSIAADLLGSVEGKHIFDLNCGLARFACYVEDYAHYLGNDSCADYVNKAPIIANPDKIDIAYLKDNYVLDWLKMLSDRPSGRIDVLCWFGATVGTPPESPTALDTFGKLIAAHKPGKVLIESTRRYLDDGLLAKCLAYLDDYDLSGAQRLDVPGNWMYRREVRVYRRVSGG